VSFHVPHQYRVRSGPLASSDAVGNAGAFFIPNRFRREIPLKAIASDGHDGQQQHGWEHVSVSYPDRCPTWREMSLIKSIFWDPEDCVVQYHPPEVDYVNNHAFCLHLWRPTAIELPRPPSWMVGVAALGRLV
jgi:hypothetical protein